MVDFLKIKKKSSKSSYLRVLDSFSFLILWDEWLTFVFFLFRTMGSQRHDVPGAANDKERKERVQDGSNSADDVPDFRGFFCDGYNAKIMIVLPVCREAARVAGKRVDE